jgi:hypothetical protein
MENIHRIQKVGDWAVRKKKKGEEEVEEVDDRDWEDRSRWNYRK